MRFAGRTHQFLRGVLPSDFRSEIFSLVLTAWLRVPNPHGAWLEPRITGLLQLAIIGEQEALYTPDPPFFICEDVKRRDPNTGKERERTDIEIHLRHHYIKGQKPYFIFESKRLNVPYYGNVNSNAFEYVGEEGMGCLLAGGYDSVPNYSGMLAYVMDGNVTKAKQAVEKQIATKSEDLRLGGEPKIHSCAFMPEGSLHGETHHLHTSGNFKIFHLFLSVSSN